jgi:glycosyltransferase involved in cell wall biosynthesis
VAHEHLENRVVMLGAVSDPDLVTLYRHCEAFVFPSLYEGFGLPVLEAMANGAPVVCSRESSVPEVAGDAAAYFDPRNTDDMTRAISSVLASAERTARMRQEGLRRSEQYSWDRTAEVVHEVLSRAGARRRRHSPRVVE